MPPGRSRRGDQRQGSPPLPSPPTPPAMPPGLRPCYNHPRSVFRLPDYREVLSDLRTRPRDPPLLAVDDSDSTRAKEDKPAPQQTATPNPGPSKEQYAEDQPTPQQTATSNPGPSRAQYAEEDQQTATPNPGPTRAQYVDDLLDKSFVAHKLQLAQRREDKEPNALKELLDTTTLEKSSITKASSSSLSQTPLFEVPDTTLLSSSSVSSLVPRGLLIKYFVRLDKWGFFHTYPDRGGPFKSLLEAQEAIDSYHVVQRKIMCMDGLSDEERAVRYALYWYHNGTRKHSAEALNACGHPTEELVKALLDKHNEDNDLVGDLAYQLEDIVTHKSCFDGKDCIYTSYSHFNMTMKTKGADANDLYFAEVMCLCGDYEAYVLTCICVVQPTDNGECHVCGIDMKHPTHDEYNHGRPKLSRLIRCSDGTGDDLFEELFAVRDEAWLKAEEARVRRMIKEGKEARSKLELENIVDGHGKRNKYVIPAKR